MKGNDTTYVSTDRGRKLAAACFAYDANMTPDRYTALYASHLSPVHLPGSVNSTFSVDLEGEFPRAATSAVTQLGDAAALTDNLETSLSNCGYYQAKSDGTDIHSASAGLTSLSATTVLEPAGAALMLAGLGAPSRRLT